MVYDANSVESFGHVVTSVTTLDNLGGTIIHDNQIVGTDLQGYPSRNELSTKFSRRAAISRKELSLNTLGIENF